MKLIKKLEIARDELRGLASSGSAGVLLTQQDLEALINALRLSDAVWRIAKS